MNATILLLFASAAVAAPPLPLPPPRPCPPSALLAAPPRRPPLFVPFTPWGGYWGGFYSPGFFFPAFDPQPPVVILQQPAPVPAVNPARALEDADRAAALAPATLTLELPAAADVWLDGEKQANSADLTRTLQSAPMKLGAVYTFRVRARWTEGGTPYEASPTSTVRAGERGKLSVYAGSPVK